METTPQPNETSGAGTDDTANLLSEFDKSSVPRPGAGEPTPQPTEPKPEIPMPFEARLRAKMAERDRQFAERTKPQATAPSEQDRSLAQRLEAIENERAAERQAAADRADAEAVFGQAAGLMKEIAPHIPEDYSETWIRNQVQLDPDLALAWSTRHDGEAQHREFRRKVNRALDKFGKYLRSLPDPEATTDRAILAAAVRGASGAPPPPAAPNFNKMSDAEFIASVEKQYGYRPKLD